MPHSQARQWYALYTYPNAEKVVHQNLDKSGITNYLPLETQVKQWSDRKKKVEVPLFKSYIFVSVTYMELNRAIRTKQVAYVVKNNKRPAIIRTKDIELIQRYLDGSLTIEKSSVEKVGDHVEVKLGPLAGLSGVVEKVNGQDRLKILIKGINQTIPVELNSRYVEKVV